LVPQLRRFCRLDRKGVVEFWPQVSRPVWAW
jgi:hypothetical protein